MFLEIYNIKLNHKLKVWINLVKKSLANRNVGEALSSLL